MEDVRSSCFLRDSFGKAPLLQDPEAPLLYLRLNMWLKQVLNFAVNVCGTILLLFMLAMIGLLYTMTAILT